MLSEQEQKAHCTSLRSAQRIAQGIDKVSSKIDDLDSKFTTKIDDLDRKFSKIETVLEGIEKILDEQSKRMTAIETRTNFQQNWFLSIQTLLAGAIITALIKVSFQ